jgi:ABC-type sugar transport system substrate-binding protein
VDLKSKTLKIAAIAATVVAVATGCSGGGASTGGTTDNVAKELKIGAIYLDTQGFYAGVKKGVETGATEAGRKVKFIETNAAADASKESQFIDTLISSQVDAILLSAVSAKASVPAIKNAKNSDIPVVCYNTCIAPEDAKANVSAYAFGDPENFGYQIGSAAADYFVAQKITDPQIGILNCEFVEVCVSRRVGFEKALKEKVPGYKIVANQEGTDPTKSIAVAENILTAANGKIDAFFGESGGAATGAVKAVENQKLQGKTVVFGSDMTTDLARALQDHTILKASVDVSGQAVGKAAIKAAMEAIDGQTKSDINVAVPIDLYTTPEQGAKWIETHPDGLP